MKYNSGLESQFDSFKKNSNELKKSLDTLGKEIKSTKKVLIPLVGALTATFAIYIGAYCVDKKIKDNNFEKNSIELKEQISPIYMDVDSNGVTDKILTSKYLKNNMNIYDKEAVGARIDTLYGVENQILYVPKEYYKSE